MKNGQIFEDLLDDIGEIAPEAGDGFDWEFDPSYSRSVLTFAPENCVDPEGKFADMFESLLEAYSDRHSFAVFSGEDVWKFSELFGSGSKNIIKVENAVVVMQFDAPDKKLIPMFVRMFSLTQKSFWNFMERNDGLLTMTNSNIAATRVKIDGGSIGHVADVWTEGMDRLLYDRQGNFYNKCYDQIIKYLRIARKKRTR